MQNLLCIIDLSALIHTNYHGVPPMQSLRGEPTNAVFGVCRDLLELKSRAPTHMVAAMDVPGPKQRKALYSAYKSGRHEMEEALRLQIPLIHDMVRAFNIYALGCPEWEADDVIASLAAVSPMTTVVVASDKDLRQVLRPEVSMFYLRKGIRFTEDCLMREWGIRPDQVVDFQSLVGDTSDSVPGVPGIGPKTATALLQQFGTLDAILANPQLANGKKLQSNLVEFADQARLSRELVRLQTNLCTGMDFESLRTQRPNKEALHALFRRLDFSHFDNQI